jgi:hypothetical protein
LVLPAVQAREHTNKRKLRRLINAASRTSA